MAKVYLIPASRIKEDSFIDDNVEDKVILVSILDAQNQLLEPLIGTDLYEKLLNDTANASLTADYQNLLVNKIWPYLTQATLYKLYLNLIYRLTNSSVVKSNNDISTSIELNEMNVLKRERETAMNYHAEKLRRYLVNNITKFPEYNSIDIEGYAASDSVQPINFYIDSFDDTTGFNYNDLKNN